MKTANEIAEKAKDASTRGEHREAERLYLVAAAQLEGTHRQKDQAAWDRAARRERRLAGIKEVRP